MHKKVKLLNHSVPGTFLKAPLTALLSDFQKTPRITLEGVQIKRS